VDDAPADRLRRAAPLFRLALAAFVAAWIFDVLDLRDTVPIWFPFLIALGLELNFFVAARRAQPRRLPDRRPQDVDVEEDFDELLLVRRDGEEWWVPYSGETEEEIDELIAQAREREALEVDAPEPVRGGAFRRLLVGLAVIGTLAGLAWYVDSNTGWNGVDPDNREQAEARFSSEAARIAGHPVRVRCDTSGEHVGAVQHADGVAEVGGRNAFLTPERCFDLYRLAYHGEVSDAQTGRAISVLAHEAWHLRGVRNEGVTTCYALQSGVRLGQRLGLSEGTARRLMRQQLAENALRGGSSAEYRVPEECRDGGRLDLFPRSSRFP
jgi:hypothetical protein